MGAEQETVQLCYALHDDSGHFTKFLGTSLLSVLANASGPVHVHILLDASVAAENRQRLQQVAAAYGQKLTFYEMDVLYRRPLRRLLATRPDIRRARYTVAGFYRLFLPELLPGQRVLYLDADTVMTCDVRDIYAAAVGGNGVAAASEWHMSGNLQQILPGSQGIVDPQAYFNSGVLLLDLAVIARQQPGVTQQMLDFLSGHPREPYFDQDVLNHFFSQYYAPLPEWAHMLVPARQMRGIQQVVPGLYHYDAMSLSIFRPQDVYDTLFFDYFAATPWCDGAFLLRAFSLIREACGQPVPLQEGRSLVRQL